METDLPRQRTPPALASRLVYPASFPVSGSQQLYGELHSLVV